MFFILTAAFLGVVTLVLGLTVFLQNRELRRLEADLEAANTVSTKYINYYNSEFEARTTARHERDEYLARLVRLEKVLVSRDAELKRLSVSKFKKLDTKRVVTTTKKKKRA